MFIILETAVVYFIFMVLSDCAAPIVGACLILCFAIGFFSVFMFLCHWFHHFLLSFVIFSHVFDSFLISFDPFYPFPLFSFFYHACQLSISCRSLFPSAAHSAP